MYPADPAPDRSLAYADRRDAVVDLHLPSAAPGRSWPLVVLVHGGFWKEQYDRTHLRPLARALTGEGFVVATPEYRRVGGGGGWPTTATDVLDVVRTLPGLLRDAGIAVGSTSIVGHSAGGQLALWLAGEVPGLAGVVALAPVADLRRAAELDLGDGAVQAFLGGTPDEVDYAPADPLTRLAHRPDAPVVVLHGDADDDVPVELSHRLVAAYPWVRLVEPACGHFELIDPAHPAFGELVRVLRVLQG